MGSSKQYAISQETIGPFGWRGMPLVAIWAAPTVVGVPRAAKFRGKKTYKRR